MAYLYSYFSSYIWNTNKEETKEESTDTIDTIDCNKFLISIDDLNKVNLKFTEDIVPAPSRNMPSISVYKLNTSNKAYLDEILNIKLKPAIVNIKPEYYPPRNPVIREMNEKFGIKS